MQFLTLTPTVIQLTPNQDLFSVSPNFSFFAFLEGNYLPFPRGTDYGLSFLFRTHSTLIPIKTAWAKSFFSSSRFGPAPCRDCPLWDSEEFENLHWLLTSSYFLKEKQLLLFTTSALYSRIRQGKGGIALNSLIFRIVQMASGGKQGILDWGRKWKRAQADLGCCS